MHRRFPRCVSTNNFARQVRHAKSGLFVAIVNGQSGYIDRDGKIVIEPQFQSAGNFSEGFALVIPSNKEYKFGYIDQTGKLVIEARFDNATGFHEGLAAVGFNTEKTQRGCDDCDPNQHWGYIDNTGVMAIKSQYHHAGDFSEGLAAVEADDGKWGYIDRNGKVAIRLQYEYGARFSEGVVCVMTGKKFGYVDRNGNTAISPQFSSCSDFSEEFAQVRVGCRAISPVRLLAEGAGPIGKLRYINKTGKVVIRLEVEGADDFSDGLASFEEPRRSAPLRLHRSDWQSNDSTTFRLRRLRQVFGRHSAYLARW